MEAATATAAAARVVQSRWRARYASRIRELIAESVTCMVCTEPTGNIIVCDNGHPTCPYCAISASAGMGRVNECCVCRCTRGFVKSVTPRIAKELKMRFRCSMCSALFPLADINGHRFRCAENQLTCPISRTCRATFQARDVRQHLAFHGSAAYHDCAASCLLMCAMENHDFVVQTPTSVFKVAIATQGEERKLFVDVYGAARTMVTAIAFECTPAGQFVERERICAPATRVMPLLAEFRWGCVYPRATCALEATPLVLPINDMRDVGTTLMGGDARRLCIKPLPPEETTAIDVDFRLLVVMAFKFETF